MVAPLRILSKAPKVKTALHDSTINYDLTLGHGGERLFLTLRGQKIFSTRQENPSSDPIILLLSFIQSNNYF